MQRQVRIEVMGSSLEATVQDVVLEPMRGKPYRPLTIQTDRGSVHSRYYDADGSDRGLVMVGGVGGGFDSPARNLYPRLCEDLQQLGIRCLRIRYRHPAYLGEAVLDTVLGIRFLKRQGVRSLGLIGHSLGGAVVIQAAAADPAVRTIVTLSTQCFGAEPLAAMPADVSVLLIHGSADRVLPPSCSEAARQLARGRASLVIYEGAGHVLREAAPRVYADVRSWILQHLR